MKENMEFNFKYFQWRQELLEKIIRIIKKQPNSQGGTVLVGDSLVEQIPSSLLPADWINNGIGGMCSKPLCNLVDELVLQFNPQHVIIHLGTNDLGDTVMESPRDIVLNIGDLIMMIQANIPDISITLISILPCIESKQSFMTTGGGIRTNAIIDVCNVELKALAKHLQIDYLDLNKHLRTGLEPKESYFSDGLHLNEHGYRLLMSKCSK
ncbi:hypothetical protein G7062_08245 [Erysipelothrix sp. HDW6C]|uniref:SGNH/GDSL hydrolase family protein n=1 Tax=Erysipelothrix sp. HDW6C TaxID=2714930 RepID=UPI00140D6845|nr:SGNH/GDSL hydrolase family protein [Erysipelothrix sp. HDW6C]QIK70281.1 hypothetical protein G7062_08245 [Erysipelothrix sp. HDW6C]